MPETIQWEVPDEGYDRVEKLEEIIEEIQKMIDDSHWDSHTTEYLDEEDEGWFETYDPDDM
tara:strand:+ start:402 stop:584 length:183 start_codon:yes stop_codon:yes gene_type:complete